MNVFVDHQVNQGAAPCLSRGVPHDTSLRPWAGGVKLYTAAVRSAADTWLIAEVRPTDRPFTEELPRLLEENGVTLRALAREVGGLDHAYLSRMVRGQVPVNVQHVRRIARILGLPEDYFPEVREAEVIAAVRRGPKLRDEIYFERIRKRPK
jgi:transcriptional regulator with XRE-family HTH domain